MQLPDLTMRPGVFVVLLYMSVTFGPHVTVVGAAVVFVVGGVEVVGLGFSLSHPPKLNKR